MQKRIFSIMLALSISFSLLSVANAGGNISSLKIRDTFSVGATSDFVVSKEGYSDAAATVTSRITSEAPAALVQNEAPGFLEIDMKRNSGSKVKSRFDIERKFDFEIGSSTVADKTIHDFSNGKSIFEAKVNLTAHAGQVELFIPVNASNEWHSAKGMLFLKPNNEANAPWYIGNYKEEGIKFFDAVNTQVAVQELYVNNWHHFYLVVDGNSYDIYDNGVKQNDQPIVMNITQSDKKAIKFVNSFMIWGDAKLYVDDYMAKTYSPFTLESSTVEYSQNGVNPNRNKLIFDFSTLINEATVGSISVLEDNIDITSSLIIAADSVDKTKLVISFPDSMSAEADYEVDLSGLRDIFGANGGHGIIDFSTSAEIPDEIAFSKVLNFNDDSQSMPDFGALDNDTWKISPVNGVSGGVEYPNTIDLGADVHNFADGNSAVTMEIKMKTTETGDMRDLFIATDVNNANWTEKPVSFDGGNINLFAVGRSKYKYSPFAANTWYHVYIVYTGNTYDVYLDGRKLNEEVLFASTNNAMLPIIRKIRFGYKTWSASNAVWYDDFEVRSLAKMQLLDSSIPNNQTGVLLGTNNIVLDYNNIIDKASLANVKLYEDNILKTSGYTVDIDTADATRLIVSFAEGTISAGKTYKTSYDGLKDMMGTTATGDTSFTATDAGPAYMISSSIVNGATNVPMINKKITINFDRPLSSALINVQNVTLTPALPVESISLTNDDKTVEIIPASNFFAGENYTLAFSDAIKTFDNYPIAGNKSINFTTVLTDDKMVDEFDDLLVGNNNLYAIEGGFEPHTDQKEVLGDSTRLALGNRDEASLIYKIDSGIRSYALDFFDVDYDPDARCLIKVFESTDGLEFSELVASPTIIKNLGIGGYTNVLRHTVTVSPGVKYIKVSMIRKTGVTASSWTPRLKNITFNDSTFVGNNVSMIASTPSRASVDSLPTKTIEMAFDHTLYGGSISTSTFMYSTGVTVTDVKMSDDYKKVILTLLENTVMGAETSILMYGALDAWGQTVPPQTLAFTTKQLDTTLLGTMLLDDQGNEIALTEGTFTPHFEFSNYTTGNKTVSVAVAVYKNKKLEYIEAIDVIVPAGGDSFDLTDIVITDAELQTVKLLAFGDFGSMAPLFAE